MSEGLKPCPFCGGKTVLIGERIRGARRVVAACCQFCGAESPTGENGIHAWNNLLRNDELHVALLEKIDDVDRLCVAQSHEASVKRESIKDGLRMAIAILEGKK